MEKQKFLSLFPREESVEASKLFEDINRAYHGKYVIGSGFLTAVFFKTMENRPGMLPEDSGFYGFQGGERKVFCHPISFAKEELTFLRIANKYKDRPLSHRDYLGSLMSLNIDRSKFSDLFVKDDTAFVITFKNLEKYLLENLLKVAGNSVSVEVLPMDNMEDMHPEFKEMNILVPSLRLDVITAEAVQSSRSRALDLIETGMVFINGIVSKEKSDVLEVGDILTVRGTGKFILDSILGLNKKGKLKVLLNKYI